jgi:hypothetical protein
MSDEGKETAIDIGAGLGEYFIDRAKENPNKTFVLLDNNFPKIEHLPSNIQLIRWTSDFDSGFPFKADSVDEANINFLMGEIKSKEDIPISETVELSLKKYERIIRDLKKCLKKGGLLQVVDVKDNIFAIKKILIKNDFAIDTGPIKLESMDQTRWSKFFYDAFLQSGNSEEKSHTLPMKLIATI